MNVFVAEISKYKLMTALGCVPISGLIIYLFGIKSHEHAHKDEYVEILFDFLLDSEIFVFHFQPPPPLRRYSYSSVPLGRRGALFVQPFERSPLWKEGASRPSLNTCL